MPESERIVLVDEPASCCVSLLPRLRVLDARSGRLLREWDPREELDDERRRLEHENALRSRAESLIAGRRTRSLSADTTLDLYHAEERSKVDWIVSTPQGRVRVGPLRVGGIPMPSACCYGVEGEAPRPCSVHPNHWTLWGMPGTRRFLASTTLVMELDGCERGPDYRILRWRPAPRVRARPER